MYKKNVLHFLGGGGEQCNKGSDPFGAPYHHIYNVGIRALIEIHLYTCTPELVLSLCGIMAAPVLDIPVIAHYIRLSNHKKNGNSKRTVFFS